MGIAPLWKKCFVVFRDYQRKLARTGYRLILFGCDERNWYTLGANKINEISMSERGTERPTRIIKATRLESCFYTDWQKTSNSGDYKNNRIKATATINQSWGGLIYWCYILECLLFGSIEFYYILHWGIQWYSYLRIYFMVSNSLLITVQHFNLWEKIVSKTLWYLESYRK